MTTTDMIKMLTNKHSLLFLATIISDSIEYSREFWCFVYLGVTVIFIEKLNKLDVCPPTHLDSLLEELPGEGNGDQRVTVGVDDDDGDQDQRQLLVRNKVELRPGREEPGEDWAREEGGPRGGPGVTVELLREVVEGGLQDQAADRALGAGHHVGGHSGAQTVAPDQDLGGDLAVLPEPGQHSLHIPHHAVHSDQARPARVPEAPVVQTDHIEPLLLQPPVQPSPGRRSSVGSLAVEVENHRGRVTEQTAAATLLPGQRGRDAPQSDLTTSSSSSLQHLHVVIPPSSHTKIAGVIQSVGVVGTVSREEHQLSLEVRNREIEIEIKTAMFGSLTCSQVL